MSDSSRVNEDNVPPQDPTDTRERTRAEIERDNAQAFAGFLLVVLFVTAAFATASAIETAVAPEAPRGVPPMNQSACCSKFREIEELQVELQRMLDNHQCMLDNYNALQNCIAPQKCSFADWLALRDRVLKGCRK